MPLLSSHVFCNHKGGAGKTTICFQTTCSYAKRFPDKKILIIDWTELGDLTKRFLGNKAFPDFESKEGYSATPSRLFGKIYDFLNAAEGIVPIVQQEKGFFSRWLNIAPASSEYSTSNGTPNKPWYTIDILKHAIRVSETNPAIPDNVYLITSGGVWTADQPVSNEEMLTISRSILKSIENESSSFILFNDTDGDRRPSPFTKLAYYISNQCIVPLVPDENDFERFTTMIRYLEYEQEYGLIKCQLQLVLWNNIFVVKGTPSNYGHITTCKVTTALLDVLNDSLSRLSQNSSGFFPRPLMSATEVHNLHGVLVRKFADSCIKPSNSVGTPFCTMEPGIYDTDSGLCYKVNSEQLDDCILNIDEIVNRLVETTKAYEPLEL